MGKAFKILPKNYLVDWGEMESWSQGASTNPDGWLSTSSPLLARESSSIKYGVYSAAVVGSGALGGIQRTVPNGSDYQGRTFKLGVWAKSASTGPYIQINDGVTSQTVHVDGSNAFVFLTTPGMKLDYAATKIEISLMASVGSTCYFDGAVLCEGEDLFTDLDGNVAISAWEPSLNIKHDQYEIASREGSFIPDTHLQGRNIRMRGSVVGSDVQSTRNHFDTVMKSFMDWQSSEKRNVYLYDDRIAECFMAGFDWQYKNGLQMITFNVNLKAPESVTKYFNRFRKRQVISGSVTEFNLSYNGSAQSKPVISFVASQGGAITTCQLENLTTQQNVVYSGTVPNGAALDIDCHEGTVFNSGISRLADFGTSDFIGLVRGTNYFRFTGSNSVIHIDYFEKYL